MKKFIFLLVSLFVSVNTVFAAISAGDVGDMSGYYVDNTWNTYSFKLDGEYYLSFCLDAGASNGFNSNDASDSAEYKIDIVLGDRDSSSETTTYFDIGAYSIFGNITNNTTIENYNSVSAAMRVLAYTLNYTLSGVDNSNFKNSFYYWYNNDSEIKNYVKTIIANTNISITTPSSSTTGSTSGLKLTNQTVDNAKSYFKEALALIAACSENSSACDFSNAADFSTSYKTITSNSAAPSGYSIEEYAIQLTTLTPNEYFNSDGSFTLSASKDDSNIKFSCTITYSDGTTKSCSTSSGNISSSEFDYEVNGKTVSKVEIYALKKFTDIEFFGQECSTANYEISYEVSDTSIIGTLYIAKIVSDNTGTFQRMLVYDDDSINSADLGSHSIGGCNPEDCEPDYTLFEDCEDAAATAGTSEWYVLDYYVSDNLNCLVEGNDEANNSYTVSGCTYVSVDADGDGVSEDIDNGMSGVENNAYCTVSCSEDYEYIKFPGVIYTNSGRYIKLSATVSGTKNCYTSLIDYESFESDIEQYQSDMSSAYSLLNSSSSTSVYNSALSDLSDAQDNYFSAIEDITSCAGGSDVSNNFSSVFTSFSDSSDLSGWSMLFPLNMEIQFFYDESVYMSVIANGDDYLYVSSIQYFIKSENTDDSYYENQMYENSIVNYDQAKYTYYDYNASNGNLTELDENDVFEDTKFEFCTEDGCEYVTYYDFPTENIDIVKSEISKVIEYETPDLFYQTSYTDVKIYYTEYNNLSASEYDKYFLVGGLPISYNTSTSTSTEDYDFSYTITNFGEYYDDCTGGRITEELDTLDSEGSYSCDNNGENCEYDYTCYYLVNKEPDEEPCDPDIEDCGCDYSIDISCITINQDCTSCLIDGTFTMFFRSISSTNTNGDDISDSFNSNDRDLGYNWNYTYVDTDSEYSFIASKAYETLTEIYSVDSSTTEPILTVELTPAIASEISASDSDNYADYTLNCYDYEINGAIVYENIFCYSDLLDEWYSDYANNFEFTSYRSGNINNDVTTNSSTESNYWTVYTTEINTDYYVGNIGGPSWK